MIIQYDPISRFNCTDVVLDGQPTVSIVCLADEAIAKGAEIPFQLFVG